MPNISRSKDNKTMKLGQLIEYRMSNIFLEKSCTKYGWEASSRHFYKKLSISMDQQIKCYTVYVYSVQVEVYQNIY